jgi:Pectate lyase superfamily protein
MFRRTLSLSLLAAAVVTAPAAAEPATEPAAARGATLPYLEYEAEDGTTNGTVFGPDRTFRTVAAEASGRRGVRLDQTGEYVEFRLTEPTSSLVVRYSIPDTPDGAGQTAPLALYAGGTKVRDLELSSVYSWVYGSYPYHNNPSLGGAQRFFDESRFRLDELPAGTTLRLRKDASSHAAWYDIDLIDTERVPEPVGMPAGFVDITAHGATPNDGNDDLGAIRSAVAAAQSAGTGVWIPSGAFRITDRIDVRGVAVRGAGPWYSVVEGSAGRGGFFATGGGVTIADLMIDGDVRYRDDANFHAALEGNFGTGSRIENVWVEHTKVGLWVDNGTDGLVATGLRIRNTFADGVNLNGDVGNTTVTQSTVRNTGDDAMAMWSEGSPVTASAFTFNTVQIPMLGNGIGIYGGTGNRAEDNHVADTLTASAGIAVGTRFNPVPLSGETVIARNTLLRTGGYEPNWQTQLGALWIYADTADITAPITVRDLDILDSSYQGILISFQKQVRNLTFDRVRVDRTGSWGIQINATGSAFFSNTAVSNTTSGGLDLSPGFEVVRGEGNSGF